MIFGLLGDPLAPQPGLEAEISPGGGASSALPRVGSLVFLHVWWLEQGCSRGAEPQAGPGLPGALHRA